MSVSCSASFVQARPATANEYAAFTLRQGDDDGQVTVAVSDGDARVNVTENRPVYDPSVIVIVVVNVTPSDGRRATAPEMAAHGVDPSDARQDASLPVGDTDADPKHVCAQYGSWLLESGGGHRATHVMPGGSALHGRTNQYMRSDADNCRTVDCALNEEANRRWRTGPACTCSLRRPRPDWSVRSACRTYGDARHGM